MNSKQIEPGHRNPVTEVIVKRKLIIASEIDGAFLDACINRLNSTFGIECVNYTHVNKRLTVRYNALIVCIRTIQKILKNERVWLQPCLRNKFRLGWYEYLDDNIKENNQHEPWKCH